MSEKSTPALNSWLEDELYLEYLHDRKTVDESWKHVFEGNGHAAEATAPAPSPPTAVPPLSASPRHQPVEGEQLTPLRGPAARIAENMTASLTIPTATSQRTIPVKAIEENRRVLNDHRVLNGRGKISFTHLIGWAIVRALEKVPALNNAFAAGDGEIFRAIRAKTNLGIAVDVVGRDGSRSLKVPSLKDAGSMTFAQYVDAFDDMVARARTGKLVVPDFEGTTISLTNPGTVGTVASVPRLMPGQGAIIATGAIDYPAAFRGMPAELLNNLGVSRVMTVTCTYDHRIIQGAESGLFLARLQELLEGEDGFYEQIYADIHVPFKPVRWEVDKREKIAAPGLSRADESAKQAAVLQLVRVYRVRGHLMAQLDPLSSDRPYHPDLDPATYGLTIWDLDREFHTGTFAASGRRKYATLREILEMLRQTYCGTLTCEYMHIQHPEEREWLEAHMEPTGNRWELDAATRLRALNRLIEAEEFEHFLQNRFVGHKRFSMEGSESAITILDETLERATDTGVQEVVIGMAHRGRINVLANIVGKPLVQIFSEFEGNVDPDSTQGSGDVKYHLGATGTRRSAQGQEITVSVAFNPSHLEAVDPVVEGIVRLKQDRIGDAARERVMPILIHGDAAFAGQGVVAETLNLSQLSGYHTGGTIHIVINNQIGFTTNPRESRSATYSTDVARMVQAPILHVNGDDPEACLRAAQLAYGFRQAFKKDVVIDMVCYRRHGHNEGDDPSYTQPLLYRQIREHPSVAVLYSQRLVRDNVVTGELVEQMRAEVPARLNNIYDAARLHAEKYQGDELSAVSSGDVLAARTHTAVSPLTIGKILRGLVTFPADFHVHPKLKGFLDKRRTLLDDGLEGRAADWATGEALAFGSLVLEGTPVRLSGQDSARGTFSQRHLEYYDFEDGHNYVPLQHLDPAQAPFDVFDSSLSEYAVMGFEFGYSVGDPLRLVIWEAQFGDFANGAQIMIDQFVASAESKWGQPSGIVLLLPHGYEGQGPEHSSARIERFLQLCAENNLQVCNCSTPAQYFHLLRRQMYGGTDQGAVRKPLVIFTPKRGLRNPRTVSTLDDFAGGRFSEVLQDGAIGDAARVRRVLICSGQIYWDLVTSREQRKLDDVAIVRLEQIYPFPAAEMKEAVHRYPAAAEVVWVQEEPRNMGPWEFVQDVIGAVLEGKRPLRYLGRPESASPAAGSLKRHTEEQTDILEAAFNAAPVLRVRGRRRR
ncbi:MAG: multifunctional oxoglutarate decarboxylase/oxoglutarate dehydrogenase thiamine pyrophosphate-binding subunit/dihydrolipoyllysine-residue succinyltransferase subunit [Bryobacteraceae bacterium]|jgi:2-oxoglutarate dehydrogenase E1 component